MPLEKDLEPGKRWQFDAAVAEKFDDMLERSIPDYAVMRRLVLDVGRRYVRPKTDVCDLGCSRGGALEPLVRAFGAANRFVGIEVSEPMRAAANARFAGYVETGVVEVRADDLRKGYPALKASLTQSVLTLQFVPIEHRQRILRDVWRSTLPGGAFVLVEKVLGRGDIDGLLVAAYLDGKRAAGYSDDEIRRKQLALEGVLVPLTARMNEDMLLTAGFSEVDCFWRSLNFAAWVAVRGG